MQKLAISLILLALTTIALADTTITYQGQLRQGGEPHSGTANLEFRLYDELTDGSQIGDAEERLNWPVEDGLFQVELDFGASAFDGSPRFLEVTVDESTLSPRQAIRPAPMALHTLSGSGSPFTQDTNTGKIEYLFDGQVIRFEPMRSIDNWYASPAIAMGSWSNSASALGAVVSGGGRSGATNRALGLYSAVGGGADNRASSIASTVGGGWGNRASSDDSTVGGGIQNTASEVGATVGGGFGNMASGFGATVPGGEFNLADGDFSFAAGKSAKAEHRGTFVWADSTFGDFISTVPNQFLIRAAGGVGINTNSPAGALHVHGNAVVGGSGDDHRLGVGTGNPWNTLHIISNEDQGPLRVMVGNNDTDSASIRAYGHQGVAIGFSWSDESVPARGLRVFGDAVKPGGGSWSAPSDRRLKRNIVPVEGDDLIERLLSLKAYEFEFTDQAVADRLGMPGMHLGLIAQEVAEVFPDWVGKDGNGYLYVTERATTALMIEGLRTLRQERNSAIEALQSENAELRAEVAVLKVQAGQVNDLAGHNAELRRNNEELASRLTALEALFLEGRQTAVNTP